MINQTQQRIKSASPRSEQAAKLVPGARLQLVRDPEGLLGLSPGEAGGEDGGEDSAASGSNLLYASYYDYHLTTYISEVHKQCIFNCMVCISLGSCCLFQVKV